MKNSFLVIFILILFSFESFAQNCEALYKQHLKSDLDMSYKGFDQTMGKGFRDLLSNDLNCDKQAALLIEQYIKKNDAKQNSLRWHMAQAWGHVGDYDKAIKWSRTVLLAKEDFSKHELRWNDFVLANIAFFQRDKLNLIKHRNSIAKAKDKHFGNQLNLKYLNSLIKYFDKPYKYAVNHID